MISKFLKKSQSEKKPIVGRQVELAHDATVYQYGTVFIDNVRYCVKVIDGTELCKGTMVQVLEEHNNNGTAVLVVKKI